MDTNTSPASSSSSSAILPGSILFIITATVGGSLAGIFGGLTGFTLSGFSSIIAIVSDLIYYAIVMGITGAVGGAIASKRDD